MSKVMRELPGTTAGRTESHARVMLRSLVIGWFFFLVLPLGAQQSKPIPAPPPGNRPHFVSIYPNFQLTAAGDAIMATNMSIHGNDPAFMGVVKVVRKADAAVLNVEGTFAGDNAYPIANAGNTWVTSSPETLKVLQGMGFNLFNAANNHSFDFGVQGVLDMIQVYKQHHAVFAGIGQNLGAARAPAYLSTPHGRVALISCTSTFLPQEPAGQTRPDMRGRPGASVLGHETRYIVDPATFGALRKMEQEGQLGVRSEGKSSSQAVSLRFDDGGHRPVRFEVGEKPAVVTVPNPRDLAEITAQIRNAREMADYVVVYMHAHEQMPHEIDEPAQFVVDFAHAAIDAGADVFVASGPHVLRPIEIYKGKVILYSLGNFIFENDLIVPQPTDLYRRFGLGLNALPADLFDQRSDFGRKYRPSQPLVWQSALANVIFRNGKPAQVDLTPIELGFGLTRPERGTPRLADVSMGTTILERLQKLSAPYGTKIEIKNGLGIIRIQNPSAHESPHDTNQ